MADHHFTAFAMAGELDLNRVGSHLGIIRKFRWEDPLLLDPQTYQPPEGDDPDRGLVYLYYFGGVVFLNCSDGTIGEFSRGMAKVSDSFRDFPNIRYQERYDLRTGAGDALTITNDCAVMPRYDRAFIDIIASVIAKSVALERIEEQVDRVLDEMEGVIARLDQGKLGIPDARLAKLASRISPGKTRRPTAST